MGLSWERVLGTDNDDVPGSLRIPNRRGKIRAPLLHRPRSWPILEDQGDAVRPPLRRARRRARLFRGALESRTKISPLQWNRVWSSTCRNVTSPERLKEEGEVA